MKVCSQDTVDRTPKPKSKMESKTVRKKLSDIKFKYICGIRKALKLKFPAGRPSKALYLEKYKELMMPVVKLTKVAYDGYIPKTDSTYSNEGKLFAGKCENGSSPLATLNVENDFLYDGHHKRNTPWNKVVDIKYAPTKDHHVRHIYHGMYKSPPHEFGNDCTENTENCAEQTIPVIQASKPSVISGIQGKTRMPSSQLHEQQKRLFKSVKRAKLKRVDGQANLTKSRTNRNRDHKHAYGTPFTSQQKQVMAGIVTFSNGNSIYATNVDNTRKVPLLKNTKPRQIGQYTDNKMAYLKTDQIQVGKKSFDQPTSSDCSSYIPPPRDTFIVDDVKPVDIDRRPCSSAFKEGAFPVYDNGIKCNEVCSPTKSTDHSVLRPPVDVHIGTPVAQPTLGIDGWLGHNRSAVVATRHILDDSLERTGCNAIPVIVGSVMAEMVHSVVCFNDGMFHPNHEAFVPPRVPMPIGLNRLQRNDANSSTCQTTKEDKVRHFSSAATVAELKPDNTRAKISFKSDNTRAKISFMKNVGLCESKFNQLHISSEDQCKKSSVANFGFRPIHHKDITPRSSKRVPVAFVSTRENHQNNHTLKDDEKASLPYTSEMTRILHNENKLHLGSYDTESSTPSKDAQNVPAATQLIPTVQIDGHISRERNNTIGIVTQGRKRKSSQIKTCGVTSPRPCTMKSNNYSKRGKRRKFKLTMPSKRRKPAMACPNEERTVPKLLLVSVNSECENETVVKYADPEVAGVRSFYIPASQGATTAALSDTCENTRKRKTCEVTELSSSRSQATKSSGKRIIPNTPTTPTHHAKSRSSPILNSTTTKKPRRHRRVTPEFTEQGSGIKPDSTFQTGNSGSGIADSRLSMEFSKHNWILEKYRTVLQSPDVPTATSIQSEFPSIDNVDQPTLDKLSDAASTGEYGIQEEFAAKSVQRPDTRTINMNAPASSKPHGIANNQVRRNLADIEVPVVVTACKAERSKLTTPMDPTECNITPSHMQCNTHQQRHNLIRTDTSTDDREVTTIRTGAMHNKKIRPKLTISDVLSLAKFMQSPDKKDASKSPLKCEAPSKVPCHGIENPIQRENTVKAKLWRPAIEEFQKSPSEQGITIMNADKKMSAVENIQETTYPLDLSKKPTQAANSAIDPIGNNRNGVDYRSVDVTMLSSPQPGRSEPPEARATKIYIPFNRSTSPLFSELVHTQTSMEIQNKKVHTRECKASYKSADTNDTTKELKKTTHRKKDSVDRPEHESHRQVVDTNVVTPSSEKSSYFSTRGDAGAPKHAQGAIASNRLALKDAAVHPKCALLTSNMENQKQQHQELSPFYRNPLFHLPPVSTGSLPNTMLDDGTHSRFVALGQNPYMSETHRMSSSTKCTSHLKAIKDRQTKMQSNLHARANTSPSEINGQLDNTVSSTSPKSTLSSPRIIPSRNSIDMEPFFIGKPGHNHWRNAETPETKHDQFLYSNLAQLQHLHDAYVAPRHFLDMPHASHVLFPHIPAVHSERQWSPRPELFSGNLPLQCPTIRQNSVGRCSSFDNMPVLPNVNEAQTLRGLSHMISPHNILAKGSNNLTTHGTSSLGTVAKGLNTLNTLDAVECYYPFLPLGAAHSSDARENYSRKYTETSHSPLGESSASGQHRAVVEHNQNNSVQDRPQHGRHSLDQQQKHTNISLENVDCAACAKQARFLCSGCKRVAYCSPECQFFSWRIHRYQCIP